MAGSAQNCQTLGVVYVHKFGVHLFENANHGDLVRRWLVAGSVTET